VNWIPAAEVVFWTAAAFVAYTFVGYPLLIKTLATISCRSDPPREALPPAVCIVLVVHNESSRISSRIENLLASDYPTESLHLIVVSDGSTDDTAEIARKACGNRGAVIELPARSGKSAGINAALDSCTAPVIVFADARQRFASDTIARLAAHFADPKMGAVSGALEIESASSAAGAGMDTYWKMEKALRESEARFDSSIGCTGAIYAIRRELFRPLPPDTMLDDVVIPMQVVLAGSRVLFESEALAFDPQPLEPAAERIRKRRTLAGNFQLLFRYPEWLLPWRNRLWWQLISHKYLRIFAPLFLAAIFASSAALALHAPLYRAAFAGQCVLYLAALVGLLWPASRNPLLAVPAGFLFLNAMTVAAFWHYLSGASRKGWQAHQS
jgi:cellulose synthase/poly-beta-1,6-N-acetylglucosamine synthase-like glycosyltransferase